LVKSHAERTTNPRFNGESARRTFSKPAPEEALFLKGGKKFQGGTSVWETLAGHSLLKPISKSDWGKDRRWEKEKEKERSNTGETKPKMASEAKLDIHKKSF